MNTIPVTNYIRPNGGQQTEQCQVTDEAFEIFEREKLVIGSEWNGTFASVYMRRESEDEEEEKTFINRSTQIMTYINDKIIEEYS